MATTRKRKKKRSTTPKKVCSQCKKSKSLINFYKATNPLTAAEDGTVNICKDCVRENSTNPDGSINIEKLKKMLMMMDKPYVPECINYAVNESKKAAENGKCKTNIIGIYFKNISSLPQYRKMGYLESIERAGDTTEKEEQLSQIAVTTPREDFIKTQEEQEKQLKESVVVNQIDDFQPTEEMIKLFGTGYTPYELKIMWGKYQDFVKDVPIKTSIHQNYLIKFIIYSTKEELAIQRGDTTAAEKWNKLASTTAEQGKLAPKQLSPEDLQGGITIFSEIFKRVESAKDFEDVDRKFPSYLLKPRDAPDLILWDTINYIRDVEGYPPCNYEDIYEFYNKQKEEHIKQYDYLDKTYENDDTSEEQHKEEMESFISVEEDSDE